jgi:glycosyltransferase involved in cell wall biosynthesis
VKIAWFSPLPPSTSGIAAYSAEILPLLRARGLAIDTFIEPTAHDFVWKYRRQRYDLIVYQLGNAACHDYMWAYLFRCPGMVVLHDAQLHQARALALTKRWRPRREDYLAEFHANHPDAPRDIGQIVAAGFGESVYYHWPHIRLVVESARLTVVHNQRLLTDLGERYPTATLDMVEMGVADPLRAVECGVSASAAGSGYGETSPRLARIPASEGGQSAECGVGAVCEIRRRHGIPEHATVVAAFGGITPEKRIEALLSTLSAVRKRHPSLHLLLVGLETDHYDVRSDAERWGVRDRVHIAGYVSDADLPNYLLAADVCACLRWPTNRETSASWLRCLGAGRATLVTDLADLGDVPTLDPRSWQTLDTASAPREPVAISIDVVDERHALQAAFDRLVSDAALGQRLGRAARAWWQEHHQLDMMADGYARVVARAIAAPQPRVLLPAHLRSDGSEHLRALAGSVGVSDRVVGMLGE